MFLLGQKVHNKNEKVFLRPRSFVELLDLTTVTELFWSKHVFQIGSVSCQVSLSVQIESEMGSDKGGG